MIENELLHVLAFHQCTVFSVVPLFTIFLPDQTGVSLLICFRICLYSFQQFIPLFLSLFKVSALTLISFS